MTKLRLSCASVAALLISCAANDGTVAVDAEWNLTCPVGTGVGCGALGDTCLGQLGQRAIVGADGDESCSGARIGVTCAAVERSDGSMLIDLSARVGDDYALELDAILGEDTVETRCNLTIVEDGATYDLGGCVGSSESTTVERPCQLSNIAIAGGEVAFDIECAPNPILNPTSAFGFNVGALGGGPATIGFSNCSGF